MNRIHAALLLLSACALGVACAPDSNLPPGSNPSGAGAGNAGGAGGMGGMGSGGDIFVGGNGSSSSSGVVDPGCGLITEQGKSVPLSLYIAFDKSSSMVGTKWNSGEAGLAAFVNDPTSAGTSVALNFFPLPAESTCDQMLYKPPVVPFGELPANAEPIIQAIAAEDPNGFKTPIYPALGGAILACADALQQKPGTGCAVLLVTDGAPVGPAPVCSGVNPEDPQVIANLAATGLSQFKVRTFVIGLQGVPQDTANLIAAAGGTDSAILVGSVNVQVEFQNALAKARGKALPCDYEIPTKVSGGEVDPGFVNVLFTPSSGGEPETILQDKDCTNGLGWYYDNPVVPSKISFCPTTCDAVRKDFGAKVQIALGCKTEVAK
ncbi:vWA domain-containing protein [Polyangium jinanense]|uniref:VWA domain-containing protein n=1 Tax=Polyangium jinanense TaxID=2829994 RepID=A0A9X3X585_9BACT|nr:vWA domain-containing protein [Polyangium jinanense]MDC3959927.1 VWA domain-containing protein [Polyangium jinanense]MDC3983807.1 VWA domain-containing protein [Polyangium jinanense]